MTEYVDAGALIMGKFRYTLVRRWGDGPSLLWIMLNPSTANGEQDDPTIRRVVWFTEKFGHHAAVVINLFALRSPSPAHLLTAPDPVGPENDVFLSEQLIEHPIAVCAWGAVHPKLRWRLTEVKEFLDDHATYCLGKTQKGDPRHPLYLAKTTPLQSWPTGSSIIQGRA